MREFRFSGYRGSMAGQAAYGWRYDSQLVRLSGACAQEHWAQCATLASNVTRLDVQATVLPAVGPTQRLADHHDEILTRERRRGRQPKFKFWYGPSGPEACSLGRRKSDFFCRIYDKFLESGFAEFAGALRYELELKRRPALQTSALLDQEDFEAGRICDLVHQFASDHGCRLPEFFCDRRGSSWVAPLREIRDSLKASADHSRTPAPSETGILIDSSFQRRRAQWLANCVRPSVQRLVELGHAEDVLDALGLLIHDGTIVARPKPGWADFKL